MKTLFVVILIFGGLVSFGQTQINVNPNPIKDKFRIELPPDGAIYEITINNAAGQILFSQQAMGHLVCDLTWFQEGTYYLYIFDKSRGELVYWSELRNFK